MLNIDLPVILASKSPRRKKLLKILGIDFTVQSSEIDEMIDRDLPPEAYAIYLAIAKASKVANAMKTPSIVIGADTIVFLEGEIINKPKDKNEAKKMLQQLSDNTHSVITGIAIIDSASGRTVTSYKLTEVTFRSLEAQEIDDYIATGSPMDKAGAYGIQDDFGAVFVKKINGCYYNVVGLPLEELYNKLKDFINE